MSSADVIARPVSGHLAAADTATGPSLEELRQRWNEDGSDGLTKRDEVLQRMEALRQSRDGSGGGHSPLGATSFHRADLRGIDLSGADLSSIDLSNADLGDALLLGASLIGATLYQARLERAELTGADLTDANLERARLQEASLGGASLSRTRFFGADLGKASLITANAQGADFRTARLGGARLSEVDFRSADLTGADLRGADLSFSNVENAAFDEADLRHARLSRLQCFEQARWINTDTREVDWIGCHLLRRFIMDQNYLEEFKNRDRMSKVLYRIWWITSDCGRSLGRWSLFMLVTAVLFAGIYKITAVDYGPHETWLSPLYFSIVTLTTLGFGDVHPISVAAQIAVMVEVLAGFIGLGGMLAIFSNKLARRAE